MFNAPKVSVLIPTYNYAHFLDETITSVLEQSFEDLELIVVDNNSSDDTELVVKKYLTDKRITYYKNEKNLGIAGNLNKCLEYAKGEYIKFLCADDKFHPLMLEKFVAVMEAEPGVSLITCDKEVFHAKSFVTRVPLKHLQDGKHALLNTLNDHCWVGEPSSVMFRRKNLVVGKFSLEYAMHIDWEMWLRLLSVGDCYVIPEPLVYIRYHPDQHARQMKRLKYILCFEEYNLAKGVQQNLNFDYRLQGHDKEIKTAVRKRASYCVRLAVFKLIPKLYDKKFWPVFIKAAKIGFSEHVYGKAAQELLKGLKINTLNLIKH